LVKIGILSDSHKKIGRQQKVIDELKNLGAEFLIHAGDLCKEENLQTLAESGLEYVAVFGNNDHSLINLKDKYNIHQEPYYFNYRDISFKLMHIPNYLDRDSNIIVFGHTHIYQSDYIKNSLYINPGEVCARNYPLSSFVLLEIDEDEYRVNRYIRAIKKKLWQIETKVYKRAKTDV